MNDTIIPRTMPREVARRPALIDSAARAAILRRLEKITFECDDLNDRTRAALRVLLTEQQAARLGPLEAPPRP